MQTIAIYWPVDDAWYRGVVVERAGEIFEGKWLVRYTASWEAAAQEIVNLQNEVWRVEQAEPPPVPALSLELAEVPADDSRDVQQLPAAECPSEAPPDANSPPEAELACPSLETAVVPATDLPIVAPPDADPPPEAGLTFSQLSTGASTPLPAPPVDPPVDPPADPPVDPPVDPLVDPPVDPPVDPTSATNPHLAFLGAARGGPPSPSNPHVAFCLSLAPAATIDENPSPTPTPQPAATAAPEAEAAEAMVAGEPSSASKRLRLQPECTDALERAYQDAACPSEEVKRALALRYPITERQVRDWCSASRPL